MKPEPVRLSSREWQVIESLADGMQAKEIADHLGISINTVREHRRRVYRKLGKNNCREVVRWYLDLASRPVIQNLDTRSPPESLKPNSM